MADLVMEPQADQRAARVRVVDRGFFAEEVREDHQTIGAWGDLSSEAIEGCMWFRFASDRIARDGRNNPI